MPTDFVDPSGLNMIGFLYNCIRYYAADGGQYLGTICQVHWTTDPNDGIGDGGGWTGDGGGGPVSQRQPQKPKKVHCKQDKKGGDANAIMEMQTRAGISDLIEQQAQSLNSPEGLLGRTRYRAELLARLSANPAILYDTGQGGLHTIDVGANNIDSRSRLWSGPPTLGRGTDGMVRSLQTTVGERNPQTGLAPVYSDLDCTNPAEGLLPATIHGLQILFGRIGRIF